VAPGASGVGWLDQWDRFAVVCGGAYLLAPASGSVCLPPLEVFEINQSIKALTIPTSHPLSPTQTLSYGYSDTAVSPTTPRRTPLALAALLTAAGERPPFIIAGHSAGGDMAIQFAALYKENVAGLVLMDAYTEAAITLETGYAFTAKGVLVAIDAYRAVRGWVAFGSWSFGVGGVGGFSGRGLESSMFV